jgi:hypothetical protein
MVDFRIELTGNAALYASVMLKWRTDPAFGLVGRCPSCGGYVLFTPDEKRAVADPQAQTLPVLPDDWHQHAIIISVNP